VRLGEVAREVLGGRISPLQSAFEAVSEAWRQVLPSGLAEHCQIAGLSGGQLKVRVASPVYLYELQLCSGELLQELRRRCPAVRIKRIRLVVG